MDSVQDLQKRSTKSTNNDQYISDEKPILLEITSHQSSERKGSEAADHQPIR